MDRLRIAARLVFIALVRAISVIAGSVALAAGPSSPFVASAASTTFATHHYDSASQHAMRRVGAEPAAAQPVASHAVVRLLTVKTTTSLAAEDGARLASRTDELTGALDPIAQNSRTSAVMSTRQGADVLAGGGRDLTEIRR